MARTRKESASDAAYRKTAERVAKAVKEQARLAKAAEDALPKTDLVTEKQRQDEIARRIVGVGPVIELQQDKIARQVVTGLGPVTQDSGIAQQVTGLRPVTQDAEIQRLAKLPLTQIELLPQEQKALVWRELARQIVEEPIFVESVTTLAEIGRRAIAAANGAIRDAIEGAALKFKEAGEAIRKSIANMLLDDTEVALQVWATLEPYIEAEADEHPELYGEEAETPASSNDLLAAAARRARADGKEIPPLKVEQRPEQRGNTVVYHIDTGAGDAADTPQAEAVAGTSEDANQRDNDEELDEKERNRRKNIKEAHERHELAKKQGDLVVSDARPTTIAEKGLGFEYFTKAVIKALPAGIENYILDKQGRINLYDLTRDGKPIEEVLQDVDRLHTAFLMWLLGLAWKSSDIRETNSGNAIIPVNLPTVLETMGIDPRPHEWDAKTKQPVKREAEQSMPELRLARFMEFLGPLRNVAAWFGDDLFQIVGFYSYNRESETVYITAPYMFRLVEYATLHATKHGAIRNVFHANIMTENQTAVELANRIAMGLILRGVTRPDSDTYKNAVTRNPTKKKTTKTAADGTKTTVELTFPPEPAPDAITITKSRTDENGVTTTVTSVKKKPRIFTYSVSFARLIEDCPELQRELDEIRNGTGPNEAEAVKAKKTEEEIKAARRADHEHDSQRTNKKMKDTFTAAIRIIMEKSDIPQYYAGITIKTNRFDTFKAPTNSALSDSLVITHNGKNPHFSE